MVILQILLIVILSAVDAKSVNKVKLDFCLNLSCDNEIKRNVCGIKEHGEGFKLKLFDSMCDLLKYGCNVDNDQDAYGIINVQYCNQTILNDNDVTGNFISTNENEDNNIRKCDNYKCTKDDIKLTCAMLQDGNGFRIRLFETKCELLKYNCKYNSNFKATDIYVCDGISIYNDSYINTGVKEEINVQKHLFIVDGTQFNFNNNINDTVDNFFAATHVFDLPVQEINSTNINQRARRMILDVFGPQKVFRPWINIPKNRSDDHWHRPTLRSCYHKCPIECPSTYAPVCGVPGIVAREPALMFQNHCFMDSAQCKMFWEDLSDTSQSSAYIESSFMFCLGDEMNGLFRFLPLVRTLQHMGRLKKKGQFHYRLKNLRFFNNFLKGDPKFMGK